jgi:cell division cycle protein 20 (cofactor of APC complex)
MQKIYDIPAHDARILASAISPDGCSVATAASDENLKFWRIWEMRSAKKADDHDRDASGKMKTGIRIR